MNFAERIIGVIVKPDKTMKNIIDAPRIEEGLLFVGLYLILSLIGIYFNITRINYVGSLNGVDATLISTISLWMGIIVCFIIILIGWPVITCICHYIAMLFDGNGKLFPNMMTAIGYTCIPLIIVSFLSILLTSMVPVTTIDISKASNQSAVSAVGNSLNVLGYILSFSGSVCTAYLMSYAVKNGEKISLRNAWVVVGVLLIVNLVFSFGIILLSVI